MNWLEEYKSSLKMPEVEEVIDLVLYRPVAFLLVISIYRTKIKPDHLTLAAMLMGVIAGLFYFSGTYSGCIAGAIFYTLFNILDCSDGQLARIKKNGSPIGRLLDGIADYVAAVAVYVGVGIGFSGNPSQPSHMVLLTALAGISIIVQESLLDYFRTRFLDVVLRRQNTFTEGLTTYEKEYEILRKENGKWLRKFIVFIYLKYSQLQKILTARRERNRLFNADPQEYFKKNRLIIRFWVFMGPSAKITTLIICSLFMRFDIFFIIVIGVMNILALFVWLIQYQIDKSFEIKKA